MTVIPKRNLPPAAEPWGRSVDARVQALEGAGARQKQDNDNTLSGLNSSLVRLSEQVGEIRTITETLVEQQSVLQEQQTQLQTQQETLTQTVAELQTVVNGMLTPAYRQVASNNFALTNTRAVIDEVTFDVPIGYSRALVLAMSTLTALNSDSVNSYVYNSVYMAGSDSGEALNMVLANSGVSQVSVQGTRIVSATPGGQLTVQSVARKSGISSTWASGHNNRLIVQVLFLR